ncbi:hypothetical protein B0H16DRAFT_1743016 [Mycena metata]|uniref:Uncharacterized protein n=1 Tax=Mycena metata TaxID=1033252 RepID=A0AAD7H7E1_9AGAR|nr:hypothetical protein B0H16DRAFT_1743016 [Mycena metata]
MPIAPPTAAVAHPKSPNPKFDRPPPWPHDVKRPLVTGRKISRMNGKRRGIGWLVRNDEARAEEARTRAREASRTYRKRHALALAHRQRIIRIEAYGKKHGPDAWLKRRRELDARRAEAQERADWARYEAEYQQRLKALEGGLNTL